MIRNYKKLLEANFNKDFENIKQQNRHLNQELFTNLFIKDVDNSIQNLQEILSDNSLDVYRLTLQDEGEPITKQKALRRVKNTNSDYIELYKHADKQSVDIVDPSENIILFTAVPD